MIFGFAPIRFSFSLASIGLILSNLIPLYGVVALGWSAASVLVIYWLETVIIGVLNIPKIIACEGGLSETLFLAIFFVVHFGGFCAGHIGLLVSAFEVGPELESLSEFGYLWWVALSFLLSHTLSMMFNFFGQQEYKERSANTQMLLPYTRIIVMHFIVLLGAAAAQFFGTPLVAVILLIIVKTAIDLRAHTKEHYAAEMVD